MDNVRERMTNTYVECLDYKTIIKKYDGPNSFFFLDPPYLDTCIKFSHGVDIEFDRDEFLKMKEILKNIEGKFLLTINDHEFIREEFKEFNIETVQVPYSIAKASTKKYSELIITNY